MKIQVQVTPSFEEVEVSLPLYRKTGHVRCHFAKVYSEDKCLWVCVGQGNESIGIYATATAFNSTGMIDCTEQEFSDAFFEVKKYLNSKL